LGLAQREKEPRIMTSKFLPTTLDEAVGVVMATLEDKDLSEIAQMPFTDLINLHFGLGQWIRNNFGLWQADSTLMQAIQVHTPGIHPDDASMVIVGALWHRLQESKPKVH
jgi:hypothetical protein